MFDNNKIEAFLAGNLAEAEAKQLQQKIDTDASFASEVDDYAALFSGFNALELEEFSNNLTSWESKYAEQAIAPKSSPVKLNPVRGRRFWSMGIAAAVALLVLPLSLMYVVGGKDVNQIDNFLAANLAPSRVRGDSGISTRQKAYDLYNSQDMTKIQQSIPILKEAINYNESLLGNEETKDSIQSILGQIHYVHGMALLQTGESGKAEIALEKAMELLPRGANSEAPEWLLALVLEKNKKLDEATELMSKIANDNQQDYAPEAKEWLSNR